MEIIRLTNDVITASGDAVVCECFLEGVAGEQDNADEC